MYTRKPSTFCNLHTLQLGSSIRHTSHSVYLMIQQSNAKAHTESTKPCNISVCCK